MNEPRMSLFGNGQTIEKKILDVVKWTQGDGSSRLFLPPIQRSVVWRNSQIINYWDSLLRGYPAGLMMVHSPMEGKTQARNSDGRTCEISKEDFQLFDGQQRLTAILLGLGEGQLKDRLKLWVDLGEDPPANPGLRFALRISSTGQPFGYQAQAPNEKAPLHKRRDKADEWMKRTGQKQFDPLKVFAEANGNDLIDAKNAVPLYDVIAPKITDETDQRLKAIPADRLAIFKEALRQALEDTPILFQVIDRQVIEKEDEYIRFFGRLGQGGTALSNDELTYSVVKHHYPEVHDRMREITEGHAGRLASEVNLVLAALRVAKVTAPWDDPGNWQIHGRPQPAFVSRLRNLPDVSEKFRQLIPENPGGKLKELLESIRLRLVYDKTTNPTGLPVILLARLPHELVDVLLLMESQRPPQEEQAYSLPAFVLYWLLFVRDSEKAANILFRRFCQKKVIWQPDTGNQLIRLFEEQRIARRLPGVKLLEKARNEIEDGGYLLRSWGERFAALDVNAERPTGDAMRILSTHGELIRLALMWLQRDYLSTQFPNYDPTSNHDEDLPIDLDHLVPRIKFGDGWRQQQGHLDFFDEKENFRHMREVVGNSLGNYRWLDAATNRSRQADEIDESDSSRDFIENVPGWNELIKKDKWDHNDVASFQRMIDLRSLAIYKVLLTQGGLNTFVTDDRIG